MWSFFVHYILVYLQCLKSLISIWLVLLLLLPSIGWHVDLTFCCGIISEIEISHKSKTPADNCCHTTEKPSCTEKAELCQTPVYQNILAQNGVKTPSSPALTVINYRPLEKLHQVSYSNWSNTHQSIPTAEHQSIFQVFLC